MYLRRATPSSGTMVKAIAALLEADQSTARTAKTYTKLACELIRPGLEPLGYRYCKPLHCMVRRRGEFGLLLSLPAETEGERARLAVRIEVYNRRLRSFRRGSRGLRSRGGRVGGGLLHMLASNVPDLSWEQTSREQFHDAVVRALEATYRIALPYFDTLSNLDELAEDLEHEEIPGLEPKDALELLLCYGRLEAATTFLRAWWKRYSEQALSTNDPQSPHFGLERDYARELAAAMRKYGLSR